MDFKELSTQKLRCSCGNEEDFIIQYYGFVVVHAYKDETPDWEEPNEKIDVIICSNCGKEFIPELFKR